MKVLFPTPLIVPKATNYSRLELDEAVAKANDPTGGRNVNGGHLTNALKQVDNTD
jgi:hypothetical protein